MNCLWCNTPVEEYDIMKTSESFPEERIRLHPCKHTYLASSVKKYFEAKKKYEAGMLTTGEFKEAADECLARVES